MNHVMAKEPNRHCHDGEWRCRVCRIWGSPEYHGIPCLGRALTPVEEAYLGSLKISEVAAVIEHWLNDPIKRRANSA